jgi:hypothetical protein
MRRRYCAERTGRAGSCVVALVAAACMMATRRAEAQVALLPPAGFELGLQTSVTPAAVEAQAQQLSTALTRVEASLSSASETKLAVTELKLNHRQSVDVATYDALLTSVNKSLVAFGNDVGDDSRVEGVRRRIRRFADDLTAGALRLTRVLILAEAQGDNTATVDKIRAMIQTGTKSRPSSNP